MKVEFHRILTACSALLLTASPALAHHFFPRASETPVSIVGTVAKFEMRNPHSRVLVDVRDSTGNISVWEIELGSVAALVGRGWQRDSLKPGDVITVEAILGTVRANVAAAREVALPDGRVVFAGSHAGDTPRR